MPETPRSTEDEFNSDWSKAVAWAQSQGISASSYLPVYQLDVTRIKDGEYPMSQVERNLEILAAHNPNDVTSAPTDNPNPSNVLGNTVSDAGKIATGIAGIFTGSFEKQLWDSTQATFDGVIHPGSLDGKGLGGTIGNWLTHTLLSYLPGAADVGDVLEADPTLGGDSGLDALLEHPLISVLDVMPGEGGLLEKAGARGLLGDSGRDLAAKLAAHGADQGVATRLAQAVGGIKTGKTGVTTESVLSENLSVSDVIKNMAASIGPGGAGVGPALSSLGEAYNLAGSLRSTDYAWLMDGLSSALGDLSLEQRAQIREVLSSRNLDQGAMIRKIMDDPAADPRVKEAINLSLNGPLRFATEESIFNSHLRPIETLDGRTATYSATDRSTLSVLAAKAARDTAHKGALDQLVRLAPHAQAVAALDKALVAGTKQFADRLIAVRRAVAEDHVTGNATQDLSKPTRFHTPRGISKSRHVQAVGGGGGRGDQVLAQIRKNHDPHQILHLSRAMKSRLSKWGPKSIDAAEMAAQYPQLTALAQTVDSMEQWAQRYIQEANDVDRAIHGEADVQRGLRNARGEYGSMLMDRLKERQTAERDTLNEGYQAKLTKARGSFAARTQTYSDHLTWMIGMIEDDGEREAQRDRLGGRCPAGLPQRDQGGQAGAGP